MMSRFVGILSVVVALGGIVVGVLLRVWLMWHLALFGDDAVVGLMARQIEAGHFTAFYWGQNYGGVEPYVVAGVFEVTKASPVALDATASVLAAFSSLSVAAAAYEIAHDLRLAGLAGVLVWVWPYAALWNSVHENGFRGVTLLCGLLLLVATLRIYRRRAGGWSYVLAGLAAGLGWWASPEIVYFGIPATLILLLGWKRLSKGASKRRFAFDPLPASLVVAGALVGSAPWWYANFRSGFASLKVSSAGIGQAPSYWTRLGVFFSHALPVEFGLQYMSTGDWFGGTGFAATLYAFTVVLIAVLILRGLLALRHGRDGVLQFCLAVALVEFPFLYAAIPGSGYWQDGRYGVYLVPLLALFLVAQFACDKGGVVLSAASGDGSGAPDRSDAPGRLNGYRRVTVRSLISTVIVVLGIGLALNAAAVTSGASISSPRAFFSGWSDPNAQARQVAAAMQADHIRYAYGDYWTSYVLDFLAPGKIVVSPSPMDVNRSTSIENEVASSRDPAWLFFTPNPLRGGLPLGAGAFSNPEPGPGGYTLARFSALLNSQGVQFHTVDLGVLVAVVPDGPVKLP